MNFTIHFFGGPDDEIGWIGLPRTHPMPFYISGVIPHRWNHLMNGVPTGPVSLDRLNWLPDEYSERTGRRRDGAFSYREYLKVLREGTEIIG